MSDPEPQTAGGKVLWHFTMSLDGFVAGPNHEPGDATPVDGVTFLDCDPAEAVRIGLAAASRSAGTGSATATPTAAVNVRYRPLAG